MNFVRQFGKMSPSRNEGLFSFRVPESRAMAKERFLSLPMKGLGRFVAWGFQRPKSPYYTSTIPF